MAHTHTQKHRWASITVWSFILLTCVDISLHRYTHTQTHTHIPDPFMFPAYTQWSLTILVYWYINTDKCIYGVGSMFSIKGEQVKRFNILSHSTWMAMHLAQNLLFDKHELMSSWLYFAYRFSHFYVEQQYTYWMDLCVCMCVMNQG